MKNVYIATELMGALIILILLYANVFELKQKSVRGRVFTRLLIVNLILVLSDAVSWIDFGWKDRPFLLGLVVMMTYIIPFIILAIFSRYIYEYISERMTTSIIPFKIMYYSCMVVGVVVLALCFLGYMFEIRNGKYVAEPLSLLYYLFYMIALVFLSAIIIANVKKLTLHGMLVALSFCVIPLISIVVSMIIDSDYNPSIALVAIDMLVIYVLIHSEGEKKLKEQNNTDELTGLLNRRAYEDDMMQYPDVPPEQDFVYLTIDINSLKVVNDTLGHAAGDELICGAAQCLRRTLGNYGRVYRTGGDEFVSMIFADEKHFHDLLEDLYETVISWHGIQVDSLAFSVGYAEKREFATETVEEMSVIAEKRMYQDKERYYANIGVDRRGQNEAHKVLCSLYTKILRINLTTDSFTVVNMNMEEQKKEMGYSDRISEWLEGFGSSGNVHPEDLEEYLAKTNLDYMKNYFKRKKSSLTVLYRRKYDDVFKRVMMEIIPAKDYTDENQSLFLYVKDIDI